MGNLRRYKWDDLKEMKNERQKAEKIEGVCFPGCAGKHRQIFGSSGKRLPQDLGAVTVAKRQNLGRPFHQPCYGLTPFPFSRAFPAGHPSLKGTPFTETGHPILLPGNPCAGSVIMAADLGAEKSAYSVNHGAGRCMGRKAADRALD